jgi:small neutral amino acid transporter SnatA (MarC family)
VRPGVRVLRAALLLGLLLVLTIGAVAPPEHCPPVTAAQLRESSEATVAWFVRNQDDDGSWLYEYALDGGPIASPYNEVRHAGVTMGLYQAAAAGVPGALRSADRGTEYALDRLARNDGWAAFEGEGRVTTGATALLAAGLAIRRQATGDPRYDDTLRELGRFLAAQTEPSGAVLASYDTARDAPVPGEYSKYYTGEAYWALARLHLLFGDEGWNEPANRIGAYLTTSRDDVEGHFPPIPDHWAAYGMSDTAEFPERGRPPLTEDELGYARNQAELFGIQARWLAQQFGPWGSLVRGTYEPRGGWYGVIGEALTGWWLAAGSDERLADLRDEIAERSVCVAGLAVEKQWDAEDAEAAERPEAAEGAWFVDGTTRMDDQQHALAGLLRTIPIVEAGEGGGSDGDPPTAWLWVAVLLLALNPVRAAAALPRAGRSRDEVLRLAAGGGALGALGVCVAAALGDPLLDLIDVSEPSFRTAAGLVAVAAGLVDLFRRPAAAEPAPPGWRAALVPVAFPVVARPVLVVIALGAGADHDVLPAAAAMAVGVALLAWLGRSTPGGRATAWARRALALGLLAGGLLLTVDGVVDL